MNVQVTPRPMAAPARRAAAPRTGTCRTGIPWSRIDSAAMVDPSPGHTPPTRVGVDVGGTFTDAVVFSPDTGRIIDAFKLPSTPADPAIAVLTGKT